MAYLRTLVHLAGHLLAARQSAAEVFMMTRNGRSLLVSSMTPSLGEHSTWWTRAWVTVVGDLMTTCRGTRARLIAWRGSRATRNRRKKYTGATFTVKFVKAGVPTLRATTLVTSLLTTVLSTREWSVTYEWATMVNVYATELVAFVFSAKTFLKKIDSVSI